MIHTHCQEQQFNTCSDTVSTYVLSHQHWQKSYKIFLVILWELQHCLNIYQKTSTARNQPNFPMGAPQKILVRERTWKPKLYMLALNMWGISIASWDFLWHLMLWQKAVYNISGLYRISFLQGYNIKKLLLHLCWQSRVSITEVIHSQLEEVMYTVYIGKHHITLYIANSLPYSTHLIIFH